MQKSASFFSDPTPVGWIALLRSKRNALFFRPHACGVDGHVRNSFARRVFQTPRLWGGSATRASRGRARISDPTPVGWMDLYTLVRMRLLFRPHACGVDVCVTMNSLNAKISDPTPVGWILRKRGLGIPTPFRPHACGVDKKTQVTGVAVDFQTPRLWGGSINVAEAHLNEFFRPHACGVDAMLLASRITRFVSDPTPVGWIVVTTRFGMPAPFSDPTPVGWIVLKIHYSGRMYFQTPRLWGGYPITTEYADSLISDPTPVGWIQS